MSVLNFFSILLLLLTLIVKCPASIVQPPANNFISIDKPVEQKFNKIKKSFREKAPKLERVDHTATVGFVLGVLGLLFIPLCVYLVPGLWFVSILFSLAAIVLSAKIIRRTKRKTLAIIGLVSGILGILFSIVLLIFIAAIL
jgi:hypothetical protein